MGQLYRRSPFGHSVYRQGWDKNTTEGSFKPYPVQPRDPESSRSEEAKDGHPGVPVAHLIVALRKGELVTAQCYLTIPTPGPVSGWCASIALPLSAITHRHGHPDEDRETLAEQDTLGAQEGCHERDRDSM